MNVISLDCKRAFDTVYHNIPTDWEDDVQPKWRIENCLNWLAQGLVKSVREFWWRSLWVDSGPSRVPCSFMTWMMGQSVTSASFAKATKLWGIVHTTEVCAAIQWDLSRLEKMQILALGKNNPMHQESLRVNLVGKQLCRKRSGHPGRHYCASSTSQQYSLLAKTNSIVGHAEGSIISSQRR